MAEDFLTRHRSKVYQLLVDHAPEGTAISLYLPDDLAEQPAVIIGRPAASFRGTDLGVEVRVPVHVLGRTFNDDGSQIEHDQPTIQSVAGKAYPAYDITTLHAHTVCPC
jgi:hypothetical protein